MHSYVHVYAHISVDGQETLNESYTFVHIHSPAAVVERGLVALIMP